ncbi:MAG: protein jag [Firmicutes bacterium]|nr:protein jag [Bacillota bacterium]
MRSVEVTGKSVDEAITSALLQLGASSDQVQIEVLEEGGKGLLGLFHRTARIRATLKEGEESVLDHTQSNVVKAAQMAAMAEKETVKEPEEVKEVREAKEEKPEAPAPKKEEKKEEPQESTPYNFEKYEAVTSTGETVTIDDSIEQRIRRANAEREARGGERKSSRSEEKSSRSEDRRDRRGRRNQPKKERLQEVQEEELPEKEVKEIEPKVYEIPADAEEVKAKVTAFLTDVLKAMGIETTLSAEFSEDGILEVNIEGEGMGVIIGKRGTTLDSLQYLTTLVVNKGRNDHVRMKLDTEGYRARRQETLEKLAINLAKKAKRTGRRVALEPMNPYERRIIHSVLQADRGVETYSEGEEPYRKVVITPRRKR